MGKNQTGVAHLLPLIVGGAVILAIVLVVVSLFGKGKLETTPKVATPEAVATSAAVKTNPFDTYKNPFGKYQNPFSQF